MVSSKAPRRERSKKQKLLGGSFRGMVLLAEASVLAGYVSFGIDALS